MVGSKWTSRCSAKRGLEHAGFKLNKPLLLEGEAGVGKTEIAKTLTALTVLSIENQVELSKWNSEIVKIMKRFKVPEKMIWSIKIKCYSDHGEWIMMAPFSCTIRLSPAMAITLAALAATPMTVVVTGAS